MSSAGLHPDEEVEPAVRVSPERLAEFDRLYAQGGMDAVIARLAAEPPVAVFDTPEALMDWLEVA